MPVSQESRPSLVQASKSPLEVNRVQLWVRVFTCEYERLPVCMRSRETSHENRILVTCIELESTNDRVVNWSNAAVHGLGASSKTFLWKLQKTSYC